MASFWFFRRRPRAQEESPLAVFDRLIEDLERRSALLRKSAVALLALRGELTRELEDGRRRKMELEHRQEEAVHAGDGRAEAVLVEDVARLSQTEAAATASLARTEADAELLTEAAKEMAERLRQLRAERSNAKVRASLAEEASVALAAQAEKFEHILSLENARDEL